MQDALPAYRLLWADEKYLMGTANQWDWLWCTMSLNNSWHSVVVCEVQYGIFEITNTVSYVYGQLIIFDIWRARKWSEWIYKTIEGEKKKRKKANIVCFGSKEKRRVELYDNTNVTLDLTSSGLTYISIILDESDSIKT